MWHGSDTSKKLFGSINNIKLVHSSIRKKMSTSQVLLLPFFFYFGLFALVALFYKLGEIVYIYIDIWWFVWKFLLHLELVLYKLHLDLFFSTHCFTHLYHLLFFFLLDHPQCYHTKKNEEYFAKFVICFIKIVDSCAVPNSTISESDRERKNKTKQEQ